MATRADRDLIVPKSVRAGPVSKTAILVALGTVGCGGGMPLLHSAQVLAPGNVSAGAGVSRNFLVGKYASAIDGARESATTPGADAERKIAEGVLLDALHSPGVAPWVSTRVGISGGNEAGLTYTGRAFRLDARHALLINKVTLSFGGGLRMRPFAADRDSAVPGVSDTDLTGLGFDVPVLVGWQSDASLVQVWGGLRGGYERASGSFEVRLPNLPPDSASKPDIEAEHVFGEAIVGLAVGLLPFWVAAELGVGYGHTAGSVDVGSSPGLDVDQSGIVLTPAGALVGRF